MRFKVRAGVDSFETPELPTFVSLLRALAPLSRADLGTLGAPSGGDDAGGGAGGGAQAELASRVSQLAALLAEALAELTAAQLEIPC